MDPGVVDTDGMHKQSVGGVGERSVCLVGYWFDPGLDLRDRHFYAVG